MCSYPPKKSQGYRGKFSHSSKTDAAVNNSFVVIVHIVHTSETLMLLSAPRWDISSELPLLHLTVFLSTHPSTVLKSLLHFSCLFFTLHSPAVPSVFFFLTCTSPALCPGEGFCWACISLLQLCPSCSFCCCMCSPINGRSSLCAVVLQFLSCLFDARKVGFTLSASSQSLRKSNSCGAQSGLQSEHLFKSLVILHISHDVLYLIFNELCWPTYTGSWGGCFYFILQISMIGSEIWQKPLIFNKNAEAGVQIMHQVRQVSVTLRDCT